MPVNPRLTMVSAKARMICLGVMELLGGRLRYSEYEVSKKLKAKRQAMNIKSLRRVTTTGGGGL
jgi:hypothetical protein